jgi:putative FmdB family regulatory protein
MPIYEYRREDGTTFEVLESITADPLTHDPETGQAVQRVLHAPAVHFKGSGFYNTDYGTKKRQRETKASAEAGAAKNDAKASEKKTSESSSSSSSTTTSSSTTSSSD